jgi:hypothetical protein
VLSSNGNFRFTYDNQPLNTILLRTLDQFTNVRSCCYVGGKLLIAYDLCDTDAPESRYDHNDNRCYADAPLSGWLCPRVLWRVRLP